MSFWSNLKAEPLRQHRWYVTFNGNNPFLNNMRYAVKKVSKPSAKVGSIQHKYLNHFFNFPGRLEWNDVTMTFAAIIASQESNGATASQLIDAINNLSGYQLPKKQEDRETIGKLKADGAIGRVDIIQVDPDGETVETWSLYRPFFTEIKYGDLDYSNEEIVEISCTIKYDWASLNGNRTP